MQGEIMINIVNLLSFTCDVLENGNLQLNK
jgi:hypothetical protein